MKFLLLVLIALLSINVSCKNDFRRLDNYTIKELSFFSQVGFYNHDCLTKWKDDINIAIKGNPTKRDMEIIDTIIKELKPLLGGININRVESNENFKISFTEKCPLGNYPYGVVDFKTKFMDWSSFRYIDLWINSNLKGTFREATIKHEFLHGLGLDHPQSRNTGTLIESNAEYASIDDYEIGMVSLYKFTPLDKACVKILYENCLHGGLNRTDFIEYLNVKKENTSHLKK
ncbi:MAG: hypothetical protein Q8928_17680 [Bacteroidota bacterium]|nr:hypothetical protein [Bacteroidota bacterium]